MLMRILALFFFLGAGGLSAQAETFNCYTNRTEDTAPYSAFRARIEFAGSAIKQIEIRGYHRIAFTPIRVNVRLENNPAGFVKTEERGEFYTQYLLEAIRLDQSSLGTIEILLPQSAVGHKMYGRISFAGSRRHSLACLSAL